MSNDIVVGIDGSANSRRALTWALDEAELRGCRVRAVLTWSYLGESGTELGPKTTEADARAMLDAVLAESAGERSHLVDTVVLNDLPANGLLDQAADAALVVVGSRGRGKIKGLFMGSVSRTVVERSPVPVVVVPHQT
jgi:nucleotide-binding universal stress UspA family protein